MNERNPVLDTLLEMETPLRDARALSASLYALAQADDAEDIAEARDVVAYLLCEELAETTRLWEGRR